MIAVGGSGLYVGAQIYVLVRYEGKGGIENESQVSSLSHSGSSGTIMEIRKTS